ncbi:MAG: ATP-binding protein [Solirubrobacteraceae bacterium]|nr:response regulator [Patulibacter sp.]
MTHRDDSEDPARRELIRAASTLIARGGVAALTLPAIKAVTRLDAASIHDHFDDVDALVVATATDLSARPLLPDLEALGPPPDGTVAATLTALTAAYRARVDEDPAGFAALLQLGSAAALGQHELLPILTSHHRRTRERALEHLARLHQTGRCTVATAELPAIARSFADTCHGVEMCHLFDGDQMLRLAGHREVVTTLGRRLANPATAYAPLVSVDADYRITFVLEPDGIVRDVLTVEGIPDWNPGGILGHHVREVAADGPRGSGQARVWDERLERARSRPGPARYLVPRPDRADHDQAGVVCVVTPIRGTTGALESIMVDIEDRSEHLAVRAEAIGQQEQLRNAIELTRLGTYVVSFREPRIVANERFAEIYGRDPQRVMEEGGVDAYLDLIHAEDRPVVRAALEAAMTGEVEYVANYRLWRATPDGPELRWISGLGRVEMDEQGPLRVLGVIEDVTERHKQQEAILLSQKREAIGTLAAGVAHDFNNVLGAILGNAGAAERRLAAGESALASIEEITRAARRAGDLVNRLLSFSRDDRPPRERYSVPEIVREACALIRPTLGIGVQLREAAAAEVPDAVGDATGLHQVLLNLVVNADYAIGDRPGVIEITVDRDELGDEATGSRHALPPGEYVRIRVRDDGPGIPDRVADRAFDPFFTTKPMGDGAGLGLAAAQTAVHNQGGTIALQSVPGSGTLVTIHLPAVGAPSKAEEEALQPFGGPTVAVGPPPRVLLVDDDRALTHLAEREMAAHGCEIDVANDPQDALDRFREDAEQFDAVITDLAMPTMNGLAFVRRLRGLRPAMPIVLTSGFVTEDAREEAARLGVGRIVAKPCTVEALATAVHELVGDARAARAASR